MSTECACVHYDIGKCKKFSDEECTSWCIKSRCEDIEPSNADRIRSMSDEELCDFLGEYKFCDICAEGCADCTYHGDCDKRLLDWLKQSAEE